MALPTMVMGIETEYSLQFNGTPGEDSSRHNRAIARFRSLKTAARNSSLVMGPLLRAVIKDRLPEMEFLGNGSRFYLDGDHPEFSVAECVDPRDAVLYDEAGVRIMSTIAQASRDAGVDCRIYKRSGDAHGHTWGCHENYAIDPSLFMNIIDDEKRTGYGQLLGTFMAVRQLLTGAGKVGPDERSPKIAYQLAQRADFIVKFHSNSTTSDRAIINQRDEALADGDVSRRLHVICGEANRMQWPTYLKLALTGAFLQMLQDADVPLPPLPYFDGEYPQLYRRVSHDADWTLKYPVRVVQAKIVGDKQEMPAAEILARYVDAINSYLQKAAFTDTRVRDSYRTAAAKASWAVGLLQARRWRSLYGILEWPTKRIVIEEYLKKKGRTWKTAVIDKPFWKRVRSLGNLSFAAADDGASIYKRLVDAGRIQEVVRPSEVIRAVSAPPPGRAGQRVALASQYVEDFTGMGWTYVSFRQPGARVTFQFEIASGAEPNGFAQALSICTNPLDLAFYLDRYPVAGIKSEVKVHPEEPNARA